MNTTKLNQDSQATLPDSKEEKCRTILKELEHVINCNSLENLSNTPDFILAEFLGDCLTALNTAINKREKWYGRQTTHDHTK